MFNIKQIIIFLVIVNWLEEIHGSSMNSVKVKENSSKDFSTAWARQIIRMSKAADISAMLNTNIDPCMDFYTYACGNWHRSNPAQLLNNIITDKFQQIAKTFDHRLETILNEVRYRNGLETKVSNFYKSCQTVKTDSFAFRLELKNVYKEFGEMPIFNNQDGEWRENKFNWWQTIAKIKHKYGKNIMIAVDIMGDIKNNTQNRLYIGPPEFSMAENNKLINVLQEATIHKYLREYFSIEEKLAKTTAKEIVEFEQELIKGGTDEHTGQSLTELISIYQTDQLQNTLNSTFDFKKFLEIVLSSEAPEVVCIYDEKYLINLFEIVKAKPKHIVENYIMWKLLQEYFVEDLDKFCVGKTKKYFGKYIDHLVYMRYRNEKLEQDIFELWESIRSTFRDDLKGDKLDWISNNTREYAIQKLDVMELRINSYENLNFSAEYDNLDIDAFKYVRNIQQILIQIGRRNLRKINEPGSTLDATEILSFTPAYNILENNIKIPVAFMQPGFFWDANYPNALKYATIGYLIAHEMIHGFDDDGRKYDKYGNILDWWDAKSTYEFEARRKCFQAQYHEFKYGGTKLPESVSQSENIADNGAIKIAFKAYTGWLLNKRQTDVDIDKKEIFIGLQFNNLQLFFVSFAQVWCEDVHTIFQKSVASGDTHAPGMYRVIGSLSNYQEFAWVFLCKPEALMDPDYKCSMY